MANSDYPSRKAYRQAQKHHAAQEQTRDEQRQAVERAYAKAHVRPLGSDFDEATYRKVNIMKTRLNWAIGIVLFLLVVVAGVLFLV
ncbi:hypothetical protein [Lacticaseibacillus nasuensis]|uniref:Uncharacterized protein n=1 Tax=Lacticaseibacillus nasuensis JCM 17158 TaxID=1291734 RepID=A0A0R1JST2_9LACO|nr:hypothetical protein [Lacticaseibacillus nasuensis]KRK74389.1 hypothetical protein FD02_GL000994 [Lacticaseibacillus nasuensis JCM 17158]